MSTKPTQGPHANSPARVIERAGPEDLVAYSCASMGFIPWNSLVLVALYDVGGGHLRTGSAARTDLAAGLESAAARRYVHGLVADLTRDGARSAAALVFGRSPGRAQPWEVACRRADVRAALDAC